MRWAMGGRRVRAAVFVNAHSSEVIFVSSLISLLSLSSATVSSTCITRAALGM